MDGPRNYLTKRSQTEKEQHHMMSLMCGIFKKSHKLTYLQIRNRPTYVETKSVVIKVDGAGRKINQETGISIHTPLSTE